jgi:hypothetical protein
MQCGGEKGSYGQSKNRTKKMSSHFSFPDGIVRLPRSGHNEFAGEISVTEMQRGRRPNRTPAPLPIRD